MQLMPQVERGLRRHCRETSSRLACGSPRDGRGSGCHLCAPNTDVGGSGGHSSWAAAGGALDRVVEAVSIVCEQFRPSHMLPRVYRTLQQWRVVVSCARAEKQCEAAKRVRSCGRPWANESAGSSQRMEAVSQRVENRQNSRVVNHAIVGGG